MVVHTLSPHGALRIEGARGEARLQQPHAVALDPDAPVLWIADSGNDALRTLHLGGGELATFELPQPLHAPSGLAIADRVVWIADTDATRCCAWTPAKARCATCPSGNDRGFILRRQGIRARPEHRDGRVSHVRER